MELEYDVDEVKKKIKEIEKRNLKQNIWKLKMNQELLEQMYLIQ